MVYMTVLPGTNPAIMEGVLAKRTRKKVETDEGRPIENYEHKDKKRLNNPPVGLAKKEDEKSTTKKKYEYDPHLDPQLIWTGKTEHTSFEVPTVSLHVHERIEPRTIIESVRKKSDESSQQPSLFGSPEENPPIRTAIEFYKHSHHWTNRLIAGDSLLVMNSLLEKEGMAGKVQMIYIDPPYGIKYGSNFQAFLGKLNVTDGSDDDLTQEPEQIKAFRDTWELGIHSYLNYLRDRLILSREMLSESGSCFIQINDENLPFIRVLASEVFGNSNFVCQISFQTSPYATSNTLPVVHDYLVLFAKNKKNLKYRQLFKNKNEISSLNLYRLKLSPCGLTCKPLTKKEVETGDVLHDWKRYRLVSLVSQGASSKIEPFIFQNKTYFPPANSHWKVPTDKLQVVAKTQRIQATQNSVQFRSDIDDFPISMTHNLWTDTITGSFGEPKTYAVQTNPKVIERCILMTTDPGDIVVDPTCGSGTTAYAAEQWGRRWITCDTSRVAIALTKQRLMTSIFDYYELSKPSDGVGSGFKYHTVPHVTLKSIAYNEQIDTIYEKWRPIVEKARTTLNNELNKKWEEWEVPFDADPDWSDEARKLHEDYIQVRRERQEVIDKSIQKNAQLEILYDKPNIDSRKARVTGPFTVEAVPAATVKSLEDLDSDLIEEANVSVARTGESLRQSEWRDELFKTGVRGKSGQIIQFSVVESLAGTKWLHALAETKEDIPQKVVVSFGPEHAPLDSKQVQLALEESESLKPRPNMVMFASFHFDPEASKDIEETNWPGVTLLRAQMNTDLLTEDLKKKRSSNQSFWLIGSPDVNLTRLDDERWKVEVLGFDYYNTKTGQIESGGASKIAMWMLDEDYDGRSLFPKQVFFPMSDDKSGWSKLARNLKAEIDLELIESYRGTVSLPFTGGDFQRVAVKVIDDRGIESVKIVELNQ